MSIVAGPKIIEDGLVLYLDAANEKSYPGSGTIWYDMLSAKVFNLSNSPSFTSDNKGAIVFDGIDDTGVMANSGLTGFTAITINIWYYSNISTATALTRGAGNAFLIHFKGAGFYIVTSDSNNSGYLRWQTPPEEFKWNMITATWDGSTMKLYTNSIKQNNELSYMGNGILRDIGTIQLGYNFNTGQPWTNGKISLFQIYNKALTPEEVKQNFDATRRRYGI